MIAVSRNGMGIEKTGIIDLFTVSHTDDCSRGIIIIGIQRRLTKTEEFSLFTKQ